MKHATILFLLIALLPLCGMAQPAAPNFVWLQEITDIHPLSATSLVQTYDGGFVVAGKREDLSDPLGQIDLFLAKTNSSGDLEWTTSLGRQDCSEQVFNIIQTPDSGFLASGLTSCLDDGDYGKMVAMRVSRTGTLLWNRAYDLGSYDMAMRVVPASDGGFILGGFTVLSTGARDTSMHAAMVKISENGDSLWTRLYRTNFRTCGVTVKPCEDSGYIMAGFSGGTGETTPPDQIWVCKTDYMGYAEWERTYGGAEDNEVTNDVVQTPDRGFAVTGWVARDLERAEDAFVLRLSMTGDSLWMHHYGQGEQHNDEPWSMEVRPDGGFVLAGHTQHPARWLDSLHFDPEHPMFQSFELIGVSAAGEEEWLVEADSAMIQEGRGFCLTHDGGYAMASTVVMSDTGTHTDIHLGRWAGAQGTRQSHIALPFAVQLAQNYPNPFNPNTEIRIELPQATHVTLAVYDMLGREVAGLVRGVLSSGEHRITFDGSELASGAYFYKLKAGGVTWTRKMLLIK